MSDSIKVCTGCGEPKPLDAFYVDRRLKSGRKSRCKKCRSKQEAEYRNNNAEHCRQWQAEYRAKYSEYRKEQLQQWRANNADKISEQRKRYYLENKEWENSCTRQWQEENRAAYRTHKRNSGGRRRQAAGSYTHDEILQMYKDQEGLCAYCERELWGEYHVDHMLPICRGGGNDWSNLALACPSCNMKKNRKTAEEFMRSRLEEAM